MLGHLVRDQETMTRRFRTWRLAYGPRNGCRKFNPKSTDELAKQRDRSFELGGRCRSQSLYHLRCNFFSKCTPRQHPLQHLGLSIAERMFSSISLDEQEDYSVPMDVDQVATREPRFLRLRSGRGGRLHIDRTFRAKRAPPF